MEKKVLFILDTNKYHRDKIKRILQENFDLEIREFESSLLMLHVMNTFQPDIIIEELQLPVVNGLSVLQYIRSHELLQNIPVIICSNDYSQESRNIADLLGHNGFLYHPIADADIIETTKFITQNYENIIQKNKEFVSDAQKIPQRIMCVDDELSIRLIFRNLITQRLELQFIDFPNPVDALEYLKSPTHEQIDLLIVDMNMPDMDGVTFLKKIKDIEHCEYVKAIACTAETDAVTVQEFLKLGIVDFLAKPFDHEIALKKITDALYS